MRKALVIKMSPITSLDSATIRTLGVAKGLIDLGYEVTYLCVEKNMGAVASDPSQYEFIKNMTVVEVKSGGLRERVWQPPDKKTFKSKMVNILRKVYHKFSVLGSMKNVAQGISPSLLDEEYYDIILSSSDPKPSHIAARSLISKGLKYGKWIQYWGDPLTIDITIKTIYPKWILKKIEKKLFSCSDSIVYVSPFTLEQQRQMFKKYAESMHFAPIPYIKEKVYPSTQNDEFTVSYIGAYSSSVRNIIPLYDTLCELENISADIVGDSDVKLAATENIRIIPRGVADDIEAKSDLLVCLLNEKGTQIPGKLYHYSATNKAILVIVDGYMKKELSDYVASYDRYYLCENNKEAIKTAIQKVICEGKKFEPVEKFKPESVVKALLNTVS